MEFAIPSIIAGCLKYLHLASPNRDLYAAIQIFKSISKHQLSGIPKLNTLYFGKVYVNVYLYLYRINYLPENLQNTGESSSRSFMNVLLNGKIPLKRSLIESIMNFEFVMQF